MSSCFFFQKSMRFCNSILTSIQIPKINPKSVIMLKLFSANQFSHCDQPQKFQLGPEITEYFIRRCCLHQAEFDKLNKQHVTCVVYLNFATWPLLVFCQNHGQKSHFQNFPCSTTRKTRQSKILYYIRWQTRLPVIYM